MAHLGGLARNSHKPSWHGWARAGCQGPSGEALCADVSLEVRLPHKGVWCRQLARWTGLRSGLRPDGLPRKFASGFPRRGSAEARLQSQDMPFKQGTRPVGHDGGLELGGRGTLAAQVVGPPVALVVEQIVSSRGLLAGAVC